MVTSLQILRIESDPIHRDLWNVMGPRFIMNASGEWVRVEDSVWMGPDTLLACIESAGMLEDVAEDVTSHVHPYA